MGLIRFQCFSNRSNLKENSMKQNFSLIQISSLHLLIIVRLLIAQDLINKMMLEEETLEMQTSNDKYIFLNPKIKTRVRIETQNYCLPQKLINKID